MRDRGRRTRKSRNATRVAARWLGLLVALATALAVLLAPMRHAHAQPKAPAQPDQPSSPHPAAASTPKPRNYVPPKYPPDAQKAGLEANVVLRLDIDKTGKVTKAEVVEPVGHGFDEAAVEAAMSLDFEPARKPDGTAVASRILYRYTFALQKVPTSAATPSAATGELAGKVVAAGTDAPIPGAVVTVRGPPPTEAAPPGEPAPQPEERTETTDALGAFHFEALPPGGYHVTVSSAGFEPFSVDEPIAAGERVDVIYRIVMKTATLEVTVRAARPPREVTKRTIEQREISRIPGTNGDALRSIQSLPGVARPPAILGLLLVRGSGPQDTQTFVDGTLVPLIYHFGGLSSVVPTEMLEKIDFYPGNFSAQYGRVMGGIVDAGIRSPRSDGYHGLLQADLIDVRGLFEGPVPGVKGWSFAVAGRRSYLDAWLGPALKNLGAGVTQAPVYYDYQVLAEHKTSQGRFRVSFFGSDDGLQLLIPNPSQQEPALSGNFGLHTSFQRLQGKYDMTIDPENSVTAVAALGHDAIDFGLGPFFFLLDVLSASGRLEATHKLSKQATLNVGIDAIGGPYTVTVRAPAPPRAGSPPNQPFSTRSVREVSEKGSAFTPAAYAELELAPDARTKIVPGFRVDYTSFNGDVDVSPRLNARYDIVHGFPRTTAKGGIGLFQQPPQAQEVLPSLGGNPNLTSNRALHYALGLEQEFTRHIEASVEGFYKQLDNLVSQRAAASGATAIDYENEGTGYVIGSEVLLKYKPDERFFGWLAYTLSRSVRTDHPGDEPHLVAFDQTHILTVLGSYKMGHGWEFGARFRLVSGNLTTPDVCSFEDPQCDINRANALFHAPSGAYTPIPLTQPNSERLPLFHSLDLRVDKHWRFSAWELSAYLDVQNVYNHQNAEGIEYNYDYTARRYVAGLPLLPSIGLRGEF